MVTERIRDVLLISGGFLGGVFFCMWGAANPNTVLLAVLALAFLAIVIVAYLTYKAIDRAINEALQLLYFGLIVVSIIGGIIGGIYFGAPQVASLVG